MTSTAPILTTSQISQLSAPSPARSIIVAQVRARLLDLDDAEPPEEITLLGPLFDLDDEVRNGGFAQYFFNPSCINALNAWFASREIDPSIHALLNEALARLGMQSGFDLDIAEAVRNRGPGSLMPHLQEILRIQREAQSVDEDPEVAFVAFEAGCAEAEGGVRGFDALDDAYIATDLDASVAAHISRHATVFTAPIEAGED